MRKVTTLITIFIKRFYKSFRIKNTTRKGILWIDVPNICKSRKEKDSILYDTLQRLEQKIKIIKND